MAMGWLKNNVSNSDEKEGTVRILGIDYGSRRIGVAVCDELGITAQGAATLNRKTRQADLDAITELVQRYNIERIVVGYPTGLDGSEGIQCEKVNRFCRRLEARLSLPVICWDETLSTKEAEEILSRTGVPPKKRKGMVDRVAASIILQGYLDALRHDERGAGATRDK
jgi:putative Holliday junction resolvase